VHVCECVFAWFHNAVSLIYIVTAMACHGVLPRWRPDVSPRSRPSSPRACRSHVRSLCLSLCLSLSLSLSLSLCDGAAGATLCLYSLKMFASQSLLVACTPYLSASLCLALSRSVSLSVSLCLSFARVLSLSLCLSVSLSLCDGVPPRRRLYVSTRSIFVCPSLSFARTLPVSLSLSVSVIGVSAFLLWHQLFYLFVSLHSRLSFIFPAAAFRWT
jgi:hypothetical protein